MNSSIETTHSLDSYAEWDGTQAIIPESAEAKLDKIIALLTDIRAALMGGIQ